LENDNLDDKWKDNIKTDVRELGSAFVNCIEMCKGHILLRVWGSVTKLPVKVKFSPCLDN
jgi:hypothetical protein